MYLAAVVQLSAVLRRGTSERGATMVEYALLIAIIAISLVAVWRVFGGAIGASGRSSASLVRDAGS